MHKAFSRVPSPETPQYATNDEQEAPSGLKQIFKPTTHNPQSIGIGTLEEHLGSNAAFGPESRSTVVRPLSPKIPIFRCSSWRTRKRSTITSPLVRILAFLSNTAASLCMVLLSGVRRVNLTGGNHLKAVYSITELHWQLSSPSVVLQTGRKRPQIRRYYRIS